MKDRPSASVDGKEVEVEIIEEGNGRRSERMSYRAGTIPAWRIYLPIIGGAVILGLVAFASITLFIWLLPIIIPVAIVWFVLRTFAR